jgi:hypothetical protein
MPDPYTILYDDLTIQKEQIIPAYEQATIKLSDKGMPSTAYMDLKWDRDVGNIIFIPTGNRIVDESLQTRYDYYYQLNQLFALATRNLIYA